MKIEIYIYTTLDMSTTFVPPPLTNPLPPSCDPAADVEAAFVASSEGKHDVAARLWHAAAQRGDARAANALGWSFDTGDGTGGVLQPSAAIACYEFAANEGCSAAQCNLSVHLLYGIGVAPNVARGLRLLCRSMMAGQEVACELFAAFLQHDTFGVRAVADLDPLAVLDHATRCDHFASYLRDTAVDYARFGALDVARILAAAVDRVLVNTGFSVFPAAA